MNKASIRKKIMKQMKEIYYSDNKEYIDWMGYYITEDNYPTYHHIIKRESLKKEEKSIEATIENGAYLGKESHEMLHRIELINKELYDAWNNLFLLINKNKCYPSDELLKLIFALRNKTEDIINNDNTYVK